MSPLSNDQLAELVAELERQLARLERSMGLTAEAARPVALDQQAVGRLSRMDSLMSQGMAKNLEERERSRLAQIQKAFERIEAGTYGACTRCGSDIPFERLFVMPETGECGSC